MASVSAVSKIVETCLDDSDCVLTESQMATSQMIRGFCEQVVEFAPICGMVLGQIAAPIVRIHSARFLNPFLGKTASHIGSWVSAITTEGFFMAATPRLIHEKNLGLDVWRGTVHGTATMMVCGGIARIPLGGGLLAACGQDLGLMLVNWGCGELTITEKVQGGFVAQYVEARVSSMRIACSAGLVRASCLEVSMIKAKYELNHQLESGSAVGGEGWKFRRLLPSFSLEQEFAANNGMRVREILNDGPSKEEAAEASMLFMKGSKRQGEGWQGTYLKRFPSTGTVGTGNNRKIVLAATSAAREGMERNVRSYPRTKNPLLELERLAAQDPDRFEAITAIVAAMKMPGMSKYSGEFQALLSRRNFGAEELGAVQNRIDQIIRLNPDMRTAYQARKVQLTFLGKAKYLIPNSLTAANMLTGFASIYFAFTGNLDYAMACGIGAALGDKFDGTAARLFNARSEFGKRFDSFSDLIGFGGGGAAIIAGHLISLGEPVLAAVAATAHLTFAAWRLLEFDINAQTAENGVTHDWLGNKYKGDKYFKGRATTVAPFSIAAICAVAGHNPTLLFPLLLLDSAMMKVNLRYPKIPDSLVKVVVPLGLTAGAAGGVLAYQYGNRGIIAIPTLMVLGSYATVPFVQAGYRKLKGDLGSAELSSSANKVSSLKVKRKKRSKKDQ